MTGYYILLVIIPLLINSYYQLIFLELIVFFLLGLFVYQKGFNNLIDKIKKNKVFYLLLFIYGVILIVATIRSPSPFISFWGNSMRNQGFISFLFYWLLILCLITSDDKIKVYKIINYILIGGTLTALYAIAEYFGLSLLKLEVYDEGVASTVGHPSFYAAYLGFIIPIVWYKITTAQTREKKVIYWGLNILLIICLIFTQTRATWLGVGGAVVFWFFILSLKKFKSSRKKYFIILIPVVLCLIGFLSLNIFATGGGGSQAGLKGKITHLVDYQSGSGVLRMIWWNNAFQLIKKSPWWGYGFDNQENIFADYYDPVQLYYASPASFIDRAHNEYLDLTLMTGVVGLAIFFAIIIYVFIKGLIYFFNQSNSSSALIMLAFMAALVTYFIQSFFIFSLTIHYVFLWLYLGLILVTVKNKFLLKASLEVKKNIPGFIRLFRISANLIIILLVIFFVVRPLVAECYYQGNKIKKMNRFSYFEIRDFADKMEPWVNYSSQELNFRFNIVSSYFQIFSYAQNESTKTLVLEQAKSALEQNYQRDPHNLRYDIASGDLYRLWASFDPKKFALADMYYQKVNKRAPSFPLGYSLRGELYLRAKKYQEAKYYFYRAISLYPRLDDEKFMREGYGDNKQYIAEIYYNLFLACQGLEENDLAEKYKKQALELEPELISSTNNSSDINKVLDL